MSGLPMAFMIGLAALAFWGANPASAGIICTTNVLCLHDFSNPVPLSPQNTQAGPSLGVSVATWRYVVPLPTGGQAQILCPKIVTNTPPASSAPCDAIGTGVQQEGVKLEPIMVELKPEIPQAYLVDALFDGHAGSLGVFNLPIKVVCRTDTCAELA